MSLSLADRNLNADDHLQSPGYVPDAQLKEGEMPEPLEYPEALQGRTDQEVAIGKRFAIGDGLTNTAAETRIDEAAVIRFKDLGDVTEDLRSLGMDVRTSKLFAQFVKYGTPGVITIVADQSHELGTLAPILDPSNLRVITNDLICQAVESLGGSGSLMERVVGTTAILHQRQQGLNGDMRLVPALSEGVLDINITRFGGREVVKDQSDIVYVNREGADEVIPARSGKLPKAVLAQAAKYGVLDARERNDLGVLIALEGRQITPAAVTAIAREMGIEGPMGMLLAAEGDIQLSAIHSLPEEPIDRIDLGRLMSRHFVERIVGAGTASKSEPYSRNGHIHTEGGHFIDASGKVWAMVYPAGRENIVEYSI